MINLLKSALSSASFRGFLAVLALGQVALLAAPASAQEAVMKERHHGFEDMGAAMKAINQQLKGGKPDTAVIAKSAKELVALAEKLPNWFPAGSGPESGIKTDALPLIWKAREKFDGLGQDLIVDTKALLAATSSSDSAAIKKQFMAVKDTCSSCHESYRAD